MQRRTSVFRLGSVFLLFAALWGVAQAQTPTDTRVASPTIVADHAQMLAGTRLANTQLDVPISTYTVLGHRYWVSAQWQRLAGGITHSIHEGSFDQPYQTTHWTKDTCVRTANPANPGAPRCTSGAGTTFTAFAPGLNDVVELWIVNLYQPQPVDDGELLAFVHEERVAGSGGVAGNGEGRTRIGLAWSTDHGNTWTYLGRIVSPYGDPQPFNIEGAPYVVKDGYFHLYYKDRTTSGQSIIGSARASVSAVLAAARAGNLGNDLWKKYHNGAFSSSAASGGVASPITPNLWGTTHTQAAYSTVTGKYYLPLTFLSWESGGTWINSTVKIYESTDAVNWDLANPIVVADEEAASLRPTGGYQYCSIVDRDGGVNATVGARMYVYCMKDPIIQAKYGGKEPDEPVDIERCADGEVDYCAYGAKNFAVYRWDVRLGQPVDRYRQSVDLASNQFGRWRYRQGSAGTYTDMNWVSAGSYWAGTAPYNHIYRDRFHPGMTDTPVLVWVAPKAGLVRVEGTLRSANPDLDAYDLAHPDCGDGATLTLLQSGFTAPMFTTTVGPADTVGKSIVRPGNAPMVLQVLAGDHVSFILSAGADNYCDMMRLDPSVVYLD